MCPDDHVETFSLEDKSSKVVNYIPINKKLDKSAKLSHVYSNNTNALSVSNTNNQISNIEIDYKIRILYFKLKKNLETLVFLTELESQFKNQRKLSEMIQDYNYLKKTVKIDTIEIFSQLSYYKALRLDACA